MCDDDFFSIQYIQYVMKSEENIWYLVVVRYKLSSRYISTHD